MLLTLNQYVNSAVSTVATINNPALLIFALLAAYLTADLHSSVPSKTAKKRMKWFILGLPYILPCENCFQHAVDYIEKSKNNLDKICDSRDNLFEFFHNFHNDVNKRLGKSICTMDNAKNLFC